jgi:hypothetical protein
MSEDYQTSHLAGIVPITTNRSHFGMPWHDCLMPLEADYTALERAVFECAAVGCETIWIVGHAGTQPLVRQKLGEAIIDPASIYQNSEMIYHRDKHHLRRRVVQIYYIPIHPKDKDRRDSLGWSILYGADTAYKMCSTISKWVAPTKYYCAFPFGIVPEKFVYQHRIAIAEGKNVIFRYDEKTVKDDQYISFTFDFAEFKKARDGIKKYVADAWGKESAVPDRFHERTKRLKLSEIFKDLDLLNSNVVDLPSYHAIDSWSGYRKFMASPESINLLNRKELFIYSDKSPIGEKDESQVSS